MTMLEGLTRLDALRAEGWGITLNGYEADEEGPGFWECHLWPPEMPSNLQWPIGNGPTWEEAIERALGQVSLPAPVGGPL